MIKLTWIRNRSQKSVPKSRTIEQILTKPGRHMLWQIALVSQQPACKMSKLNVTRGQSYIWRPGGGIIRDPVVSYSFYIFCIMIICAVILVCHICWLMKPRFSQKFTVMEVEYFLFSLLVSIMRSFRYYQSLAIYSSWYIALVADHVTSTMRDIYWLHVEYRIFTNSAC